MDRNKIIKMVVILAVVVVIATSFSKYLQRDSMSLTEYARLQGISETQSPPPSPVSSPGSPTPDTNENAPEQSLPAQDDSKPGTSGSPDSDTEVDNPTAASTQPPGNAAFPSATLGSDEKTPASSPSASPDAAAPSPGADNPEDIPQSSTLLTGASLNGYSQLAQRVLLEDGFYYEPLSTQLCRYITGVSYPASEGDEADSSPEITLEELRYVHILHYDFEGNPTEGELICNEFIAQDLVEIFYELYRNEYQLEKVLLIDEYDGDDNASMEDNNTSCFNYRPVEGSTNLSKHALGLAIDINPLYNPYITYTKNGEENILPASASAYANRSASFPYKIDENDLCYKLFIQHGFTWGGNWNNVKDYQHFQKSK